MDGSGINCLLHATLLTLRARLTPVVRASTVFLTHRPLLCPHRAPCTVTQWGYWKTVLQLFALVPARAPETVSVTECLGLFQNTSQFFSGCKGFRVPVKILWQTKSWHPSSNMI